ncbi:inter-alpha-trypsin inhibitor heavy chain H4-like [Glandiceps talaboti]
MDWSTPSVYMLLFSLMMVFTSGVTSINLVAVHSKHHEHNVKHGSSIFRRDVEEPQPLDISSLHVSSSITARYSKTIVSSRMINSDAESKEAIFKMQLPETAFVSNFSMEIGDVLYYGIVKEKAQAQREYDKAKEDGRTAGQVSAEQPSRGFTPFTISVNVAAQSSVTFTLMYEELLQRRFGFYEHRTSIRPGQVIPDLKIDVYIIEPAGLATDSLIVPKIQTDDTKAVSDDNQLTMATVTVSDDDKSAHIYYYPSEAQQMAESENGIMGNFIVRYDVHHNYDAGEILVIGDYFVHFFAPPSSASQLSVFPKNVIFIIDVSGSMDGRKLDQTKDAMVSILSELRGDDKFNILTFSDDVYQWRNNELVMASSTNVNAAKSYVNKLNTIGGTNINDGVLDGISLMRRNTNVGDRSAQLLILLTDGDPTVGVTNIREIMKNVRLSNEGQFSLFCLGFGNSLNFEFLEAMSYENNGVARKIYEDADASLQLTGFFDEVATPLLMDVQFTYIDNTVLEGSVTTSTFPNYFGGSEIVVAGKVSAGNVVGEVRAEVTAMAVTQDVMLTGTKDVNDVPAVLSSSDTANDFTERLWVYLTINDLLKESLTMEDNSAKKNQTLQEALQLSLQYNLVTPLTSIIVIGPEMDGSDSASNVLGGDDDEAYLDTMSGGGGSNKMGMVPNVYPGYSCGQILNSLINMFSLIVFSMLLNNINTY